MSKIFYSTISESSEFELPKIKWSRFIGNIFHVENKEQAESALQEVKKKHSWANHHCFAYRYEVLVNPDIFGNNVISTKYNQSSDDGEPASTAGKPIMQIVEKWNILNVLLVVTRYFWWTKLGVGGLIQAYSECAKQTLAHAAIREAEITSKLHFSYDFDLTQTIRNIVDKYQAKIVEEHYDDEATITLEINQGYVSAFLEELKDMSKWAISTKSVEFIV